MSQPASTHQQPTGPIRALVFDFDGTILDTETLEFRRWEALYTQHGRRLALSDWQQGIGTWGAFDPWAGLPEAVRAERERVQTELHGLIHADISGAELRPGVRELLEQARQAGLRLGLCTSSAHDWIDPWLAQHGLTGLFEAEATRDDVNKVKPDPELYLLACQRLGLPPAECLAIEDSYNGASAAAAAGLRVLVVPNEVTLSQPFRSDWARLESFAGGLEALLRAAGATSS
ncbi:HAD family hydrolase [Deinococcus sp.]|uniref:HAD family hydrolase n=1 Tax=Deinococcus sp. TaxID=47478 RepID=UPI003CC6742A